MCTQPFGRRRGCERSISRFERSSEALFAKLLHVALASYCYAFWSAGGRYEFFNSKQKIASVMQRRLDQYFQWRLHAVVESVQINEDDLPQRFLDAILAAADMRQNITRVGKVLEAKQAEPALATAAFVIMEGGRITVIQLYTVLTPDR